MTQETDLETRFGAKNYDSLPVMLVRGSGCTLWDDQGGRYLDMMSAYSSASLGHSHPAMLDALINQAAELDVVSRAFHARGLGQFLKRACGMTGQDMALPMNTGAEAMETALKAVRQWAYEVKGVTSNEARIIACEGNFHGRTIAITGMSTEPRYRQGFGPFPPGFDIIPFGDHQALEDAIENETAAFVVEPIQGEAGIRMPPPGYLARCADICRRHNVLLICDEVQTGLGRTGALLAADHEGVKPDGVVLGKALGGGVYPVSLFLSRRDVMQCFAPGSHGSTFGGNPIASAVGLKFLEILEEERLADRSRDLGEYLKARLQAIQSPLIREVRGCGLFIGLEIDPDRLPARAAVLEMMKRGILTRDTHGTVIRLAPPLIVTREQIDTAVDIIETSLISLLE